MDKFTPTVPKRVNPSKVRDRSAVSDILGHKYQTTNPDNIVPAFRNVGEGFVSLPEAAYLMYYTKDKMRTKIRKEHPEWCDGRELSKGRKEWRIPRWYVESQSSIETKIAKEPTIPYVFPLADPTADVALSLICDLYEDVSREDIIGKSKNSRSVEARFVLYNVLHRIGKSVHEIGRLMYRDHSTVLYALFKPNAGRHIDKVSVSMFVEDILEELSRLKASGGSSGWGLPITMACGNIIAELERVVPTAVMPAMRGYVESSLMSRAPIRNPLHTLSALRFLGDNPGVTEVVDATLACHQESEAFRQLLKNHLAQMS